MDAEAILETIVKEKLCEDEAFRSYVLHYLYLKRVEGGRIDTVKRDGVIEVYGKPYLSDYAVEKLLAL